MVGGEGNDVLWRGVGTVQQLPHERLWPKRSGIDF